MSDERRALVRHMVNRFLGWKLPATFSPDAGVSFKPYHPDQKPDSGLWPSGTNLLDATQAKAMVEHMLEGAPAAPAGMAVPASPEVPIDAIYRALDEFGRRERGIAQAHIAAELIAELHRALAASPSAQAAPARGAMTKRQKRVAAFALWRFASDARAQAEAAAQDTAGRFAPGAVDLFLADARDADALMAAMGITAPAGGEEAEAC